MTLFTRRATIPTWPICCKTFTRNRQRLPSRSSVWAKSTPPSSSKIRFRRSCNSSIGKISRTISSVSIGSRFSGRSVPWTRTNGGTADLQVQIASLELHQRPEKLVDFQLLSLAEKALLIV